MTLLTSPLNKDYSHLEYHNDDGTLLDSSNQFREAVAKIPRLKRQRGRFRLPPSYHVLRIKRTNIGTGEVSNFELFNQYYEKIEVTEDTIRNTLHVPKKVQKGKIIDSGGEFTHYTIEYTDPVTKSIHGVVESETQIEERSGVISLYPPSFEHDGIDIRDSIKCHEDDLDLSGVGPRLWGLMNPLRTSVDLGVNIAEARDLPRLTKNKLDSLKSLVSSLSNPKGLADWLLALQFGWAPINADIKKCVKLFYKIDARINFLMINGGEPLRRRTPPWEPTVTTEVLLDESSSDNPGWMFDHIPSDGDPDAIVDRHKTKITLKKTSMEIGSGVFTYSLGNIPPTPAYLRLKLIGLIPDEALMWEATRWSWLVDWFTNVGDIIRNIESTLRDRVVSLYAYAQREIKREYTFTCSNGFYEVSVTRTFIVQRRVKIDPFGLAVGAALSDIQLGILVALGLTRV